MHGSYADLGGDDWRERVLPSTVKRMKRLTATRPDDSDLERASWRARYRGDHLHARGEARHWRLGQLDQCWASAASVCCDSKG